jgi:colanic acid/amylovoran biosynthesis glycosyltransferase
MLKVAYLANQFPSAVEPYVIEEIEELRRRGVRVVAGSVRKSRPDEALPPRCAPEVVLEPLSVGILLRAMWLCVRRWRRISPLIARIGFRGREGPIERCKALAHTGMGACYAALLEWRGVGHIHVHHGYFGSWIGMTAARLLGVGFSVTLHGSDLLLHGVYLDLKLESCTFCLTVSEYNRRYILERYPGVDAAKVVVARLGVEVAERVAPSVASVKTENDPLRLLAVGRLHAVKDHAFLVRACEQLQDRNVRFECAIAGDGPERRNLESLIRKRGLEGRVQLLGHMPHERMDFHYDRADVVVLTSQSEGIPLVLMEAMARGKIVLAPAITGIPELVIAGRTGFLYEAGSLQGFVDRLLFIDSLLIHSLPIHSPMPASDHIHPGHVCAESPPPAEHLAGERSAGWHLDWVRHAARVQVRNNFNRSKNLNSFGGLFVQRIAPQTESIPYEDFVLQQI